MAAWVQSNAVDPEKQKATQAGGGLKIAGSDPNKKEEDGIGVVISTDKDEATRKLERDAEAEAKRQQNALPAWHLKSTITGDLTALGIKENARAEANGNAAPSSNDDILRGLGVVGMRPDRVPEIISVEQDVKPTINREAECEQLFPQASFPANIHRRLRAVLRVTCSVRCCICASYTFRSECPR